MGQYGKFYNDVSVVENVGVHMLAVFRYIIDSFEQYDSFINFNSVINDGFFLL